MHHVNIAAMSNAQKTRKPVTAKGISPPAPPLRAYAGKSLDERRAERREKLLAAGLAVIGELGYSAATVKAVCAHAGLTERYFYESFENGEALLSAVYLQLVGELRQAVLTALASAPQQPRAMAMASLNAYFQFNRDPHSARILLVEILGVSPAVDALYRSATEEFAGIVRGISEPLVKDLPRANYDLGMVAYGLVGTLVHMAMHWHLGRYRQPLAVVTGSAMAIFDAVQSQWLQAAER